MNTSLKINRDNRINAVEYAILKFMSHCLFDPTIDQMMSMSREIKTLNITRDEVIRGLAHLVVLGWIKHTRNYKTPNDPKPTHGFMYLHNEERRAIVEEFEARF